MKKKFTPLGLSAVLLLGASFNSNAATATWDGDTDSFWTTALNWDAAPGVGDNIIFPNVAAQAVDLNAGTFGIGALTFNAPDAYSVANGQLTLGGNVTQSGAGTVALNAVIDLGGADRLVGGAGAGVMTLNSPITGANNATFGPGNFVIASSANTLNQIVATTGGKVAFQGTTVMADFPNASYFGGDGVSSGAFVKADGGVVDYQVTYTENTVGTNLVDFIGDWALHGIEFGTNGGTLLLTNKPVDQGVTFYRSSATNGTPGTVVVNQPLPFTGDGRNGTNYVGPWAVPDLGLVLGPYGNAFAGAANLARRQGEGDMVVVITNGATAVLAWSVMTNGNLIIKGHPGGDSSVAEVDGNGTTKNVGRLAIRRLHGATQQPGYTAAFFLNQPYAVQFHDALQVLPRENRYQLACDMVFESGSSVDFAGYKTGTPLRVGYPTGNGGTTATNKITIKGGAKVNLNAQLRTQYWEGNGQVTGDTAPLSVFSHITIEDNGQLKMYRSQNNSTTLTVVELFRPITGLGTTANDARMIVNLPFANNSLSTLTASGGNASGGGVNFNGLWGGAETFPGADLIVNGAGDYGLRIQGAATNVGNATANGRYGRISGSGGTLTLAADNNAALNVEGPTNVSSAVSLGLDSQGGSTPTYILLAGQNLQNYAGLILKGGTAAVNDSSSVSMKTLRLAGSAGIQLGTGAGGSILTFANSSATAWNAGTLTITSWNGNTAGGGSDQIRFGTDATGLTAGQLAKVRWIAPNGGANVAGAQILSTGEIVPAPATTIASQTIIGGQIVLQVVPGLLTQTSVVQCATNLTPPIVWQNVLTNTGTFNFTNNANLPESYYRVLVP